MARVPTTNLADVARRASVSTTTVSRYFNEPTNVKRETRERIARAIKDLGYVPNGAARTLASNRSRIVGAVVPTLDLALFSRELGDLERCLGARGYGLIVAAGGYDPDYEHEVIQTMLSRHVDGLVLVGVERDPGIYHLLQTKRIPYVTTWSISRTPHHPEVGIDNFSAARSVADHLLDLGHKRFGVIEFPTLNNDRARARLAGFTAAIKARGHSLERDRVLERPVDFVEGQIALRHLMDLASPPTAILCGGDVFAIGAILESRKLGIRVPDDVSITGFDNMPLSALIEPALTTIDLSVRETSQRAAEYLLETLAGRSAPRQSVLEHHLMLRESTAPPSR